MTSPSYTAISYQSAYAILPLLSTMLDNYVGGHHFYLIILNFPITGSGFIFPFTTLRMPMTRSARMRIIRIGVTTDETRAMVIKAL